ncbi:MAG: tagaturonate reductase [Oscillospiraceae bacterium]|nr:tagaturonate reductase [Oscillospiraceae bacterium]
MNYLENLPKQKRPIRVVQFGEGNFLRAFVDYMIDIANEKGVFNGNIAIVKPIAFGSLENFHKQNNNYTVVLRGKENGKTVEETRVVTSVEQVVDCTGDLNGFLSLAELESLRFVVSNTTEAGITLDEKDHFEGLPETYPGKLTKFLYHRYQAFSGAEDKGLILLPVELIEHNGRKLKECVLALIRIWSLPDGFARWVENSCVFCTTLVDRIVTGYPRDKAQEICQKLGYTDLLLDVCEPFALWVIESEKDISGELPLHKLGLPVVFTDNLKPYRDRKVRVLNGAHTSSVLAAYLCGQSIVRDCMQDAVIGQFIRRVVMEEIVPQVKLPEQEVRQFAESVFERFENPFIDHALLSISLNSVSKWRARVLPTFRDHFDACKQIPKLMTFSFAALLAFYRSEDLRQDGLYAKRPDGTEYVIHDDAGVLAFFAENSKKENSDYVGAIAANKVFWGEDMTAYPEFIQTVTKWLALLERDPIQAVRTVLE